VHEPYGGKLFARVASASRADARAAVDAAAKAFPGWAETTPAERASVFLKAAEIMKRRRNEIAEILVRETGSTISFSTFQMDLVAATLQQVAGWVYLPKGEILETNQPNTHSIGLRRPLGVCASFTPWNGANSDFKVTDAIEQGSRVALFGSFTYKSNATGKEITSPFSLLARFEEDKVAYVQFLEDSYGTAGSFKTGGATRFHSDPSGKEVEV